MKKEYLENKTEKELENYNNYVKKLLEGKTDCLYPYPYSRFEKLNSPITNVENRCFDYDKERIWSQIPFSGTTLMPLINISKERFLEMHGFEISDIPDLIKLSKETGKVQFFLTSYPTNYEGLDHLDPIFEELDPPLMTGFPFREMYGKKIIYSWETEFDTLGKISYYRWAREHSAQSDNFHRASMQAMMNAYVELRAIGLDELTEEISNKLLDDPLLGESILAQAAHIVKPIFDISPTGRNWSLKRMQEFSIKSKKPSNIHLLEIGSKLMTKLTPKPTNYEACVAVIHQYKENDLYKLLESMQRGVKERNRYSVIENLKEIEETIDNIWNDTNRFTAAKKTVKAGLSITVGLVGGIGTSLIGAGYVGLLAGLGIHVADSFFFEGLSEKIIKNLNKDYLVNVYDFQQKYPQTVDRIKK